MIRIDTRRGAARPEIPLTGALLAAAVALQAFGGPPRDTYFHADDLSNVMAISDLAAGAAERYEHADYGRPVDPVLLTPSGMPAGTPFGFTGRRGDAETGLYYYRTRYLDPQGGRFTTRDTLGIWGDSLSAGSGYAYCGQNPATLVDPSGRGLYDDCVKNSEEYCDEAARHPQNTWLGCVCKVSKLVCVAGKLLMNVPNKPFSTGWSWRDKGYWIFSVNKCIFRHWQVGMREMYGGGGGKQVTGDWKAAAQACTSHRNAESSKECCSAMVQAEQSAIDTCIGSQGAWEHTTISKYNPEWGGPFDGPDEVPKAIRDAAKDCLAGGLPGFEGDFTKLADRVKFGIKTCCPDPPKRKLEYYEKDPYPQYDVPPYQFDRPRELPCRRR